ncbi:Oidioi.mRNA.OKI2018_I69.chr1.g207.t1.cds [Oikopleura dioica]|uniref:Oidioi.mRNA.OKI2018_I69.chr1.g207.t1.cds n=1 Tax=Oikopleura dioica TaxID=34765 RepID=A0ABN7SPB8_OIKDI|nr:Oidioi.mRNA.OKI2018_I69.chr1.g207.t1.cds [Oikopleura dioica]
MSRTSFNKNNAVEDVSKRQIALLFDNLEQTDQLRRCEKRIKGLQRQTGLWGREVFAVDEIINDRRNEIRSLDRWLADMLNRPDIDQLNADFSDASQCQKWSSSLRYMDEIQNDVKQRKAEAKRAEEERKAQELAELEAAQMRLKS